MIRGKKGSRCARPGTSSDEAHPIPVGQEPQCVSPHSTIPACPSRSWWPWPVPATAARAQIPRVLERAVDDLPEPFRLVFILREVEELSVEETAQHLGLKVETVKTRLHRARRRLREALDAQLADVMVGAYPFLGA